jgi:hypothetical protein
LRCPSRQFLFLGPQILQQPCKCFLESRLLLPD